MCKVFSHYCTVWMKWILLSPVRFGAIVAECFLMTWVNVSLHLTTFSGVLAMWRGLGAESGVCDDGLDLRMRPVPSGSGKTSLTYLEIIYLRDSKNMTWPVLSLICSSHRWAMGREDHGGKPPYKLPASRQQRITADCPAHVVPNCRVWWQSGVLRSEMLPIFVFFFQHCHPARSCYKHGRGRLSKRRQVLWKRWARALPDWIVGTGNPSVY